MTAAYDHRPRSAVVATRKAAKRALPQLPNEHFRCADLRLTTTRERCAGRYEDFNRPIVRGRNTKSRVRATDGQQSRIGSSCTGCEIGQAHHAGKRHKSAPTVQAPVRVVQESIGRTVQLGVGGCSAERYPNPKSKHMPMAPSRPVVIHGPTFAPPTLEEW